jgi:hypothetical protein
MKWKSVGWMMDVRAEIDDLKRRVGDLEGAVNVLSGRIGQVHPEILALKQTAGDGFNRVNVTLDRLVVRLDNMNTQIWSLRDDLPEIVKSILKSEHP